MHVEKFDAVATNFGAHAALARDEAAVLQATDRLKEILQNPSTDGAVLTLNAERHRSAG